MKKQHSWKEQNLHHIVWQCNRRDFNVDIPENKIIVEITKHEALNTLMGINQDPKSQLRHLTNNWWYTVLSEETKIRIMELLNIPDKDFYIKWLKNDRKTSNEQNGWKR